jgi:hypothetical protein
MMVWRVADQTRVVRLPVDGDYTGSWTGARFSFDERSFLAVWQSNGSDGAATLYTVDLEAGTPPAPAALPKYTSLLGVSDGCAVLYTYQRGLWRPCDGSGQLPVPVGYTGMGFGAVVSDDGTVAAVRDVSAATVTLWGLDGAGGALRAFGPRPAENDYGNPGEAPYAVTGGGARVVTGALPSNLACYAGPGFPVRVQDGATGEVLDELPPGPTSFDDGATRVAYGAQLWCAR